MMTNLELLSYLDSLPFKFWACPNCEKSMVDWTGDRATCRTCGKTNGDRQVEASKG